MITLSSADINMWIAGLLWPLTRILGLLAASPLFGNNSVPATVKVSLGVMLAMIVAPTVPALPAADPMSMAGLLILAQEMLIGLAMGFTIRIVFAAVELAGEISSLTMGLGFATFFDPNTRGRSSAISGGFKQLADWGGRIFSTGVQLSLPIVAALLITNVALGILTRAAPALNLFGIGFPITLGVGLLVVAMVLPYLATPMQNLFLDGIERARLMPRTWSQRTPPVEPASLPNRPPGPAR